MKFFITLLSIIIFSSSSFTQTPLSKGTLNLNGIISYSSQNFDNSNMDRNVLAITPQIGYFFFNGISLNALFQYNSTSFKTNWGMGPNLKYYFRSKKVVPFISVGYLYTKSNITPSAVAFNAGSNIFSNNEIRTGYSLIFSSGLDLFITKNVALESIVSYSFNKETLPDGYRSIFKSLDVNSHTFNIGIGINFFLQ